MIKYLERKDWLMTSGEIIDETILKYSTRGMDVLRKEVSRKHCEDATRALLNLKRGTVCLYTGFYVKGHAETDGPIGTYFLYKALDALGFDPVILTDSYCDGFFKEMNVRIFDTSLSNSLIESVLFELNPVAHISVERCGRTREGRYANMRGIDIGQFTAPLDRLFEAGAQSAPTFAIGDGGNEIGMGNFEDTIQNHLKLSPCMVRCDYPIIASVSNWGCYGMIANMSILEEDNLFPTINEVETFLQHIVNLGSVDGVLGTQVCSVDGKDWAEDVDVLDRLTGCIDHCIGKFNMSDDYDLYSKSQHDIGERLIERMANYVDANAIQSSEERKCLDLGCGPGGVTEKLHQRFKNLALRVEGMDVDASIIRHASDHYPQIQFYCGSMYDSDPVKSPYDFIFCNEVIHWMPPIPNHFLPTEGIIYSHLEDSVQAEYIAWGNQQLKKSFSFIKQNLNGYAFLQFGLKGQLQAIYDLLTHMLVELFPEHLSKVSFPLYYPSPKDVRAIAETAGIEIISMDILTEDLVESNAEEVVSFIRAFSGEYFLTQLGEDSCNAFFEKMIGYVEAKLPQIRENQWKRCMMTIRA